MSERLPEVDEARQPSWAAGFGRWALSVAIGMGLGYGLLGLISWVAP